MRAGLDHRVEACRVAITLEPGELEAQALQAVALALLQYSPLVAQGEEATLLVDAGASLRLFGGVRALCRHIAASLRALGYTAQLSCAPTARGAWLLARAGTRRGRVLGMASLVRRLDRLPCALLPPARPWLERSTRPLKPAQPVLEGRST